MKEPPLSILFRNPNVSFSGRSLLHIPNAGDAYLEASSSPFIELVSDEFY